CYVLALPTGRSSDLGQRNRSQTAGRFRSFSAAPASRRPRAGGQKAVLTARGKRRQVEEKKVAGLTGHIFMKRKKPGSCGARHRRSEEHTSELQSREN